LLMIRVLILRLAAIIETGWQEETYPRFLWINLGISLSQREFIVVFGRVHLSACFSGNFSTSCFQRIYFTHLYNYLISLKNCK